MITTNTPAVTSVTGTTRQLSGSIEDLIALLRQGQRYHPNVTIRHTPAGGVEVRFHGEWAMAEPAPRPAPPAGPEPVGAILRRCWSTFFRRA